MDLCYHLSSFHVGVSSVACWVIHQVIIDVDHQQLFVATNEEGVVGKCGTDTKERLLG
jgi:hypothetical protein